MWNCQQILWFGAPQLPVAHALRACQGSAACDSAGMAATLVVTESDTTNPSVVKMTAGMMVLAATDSDT
jgi:hypothetical protein